MLQSKGRNTKLNKRSARKTSDTRKVSKVNVPLTPLQAEFINYVLFHGVLEFSKSLQLIHELALYHTDIQIDKEEKIALFNMKLLWEHFEEIGKEK